jgi:hypothetical protein
MRRKLSKKEIANLYIKYPKMFDTNPPLIIKEDECSREMFMYLNNKRYLIIDEDGTDIWYEV